MKTTYLHNLTSSFYLWLDHEILNKGQAFFNYSGKLYPTQDPNFSNNYIYGSPFRQWVYDSSISGAIIASGIYHNNVFIPKNSNLKIDYNKGRSILNTQLTNSQGVSAHYSFKEYNLYYTDEREEKLLFEKAYNITPKTNEITGSLGYLDTPYPCIFVKHRTVENKPFAFGGEDKTENMVRCIVLASNSFSLDGLISILNDSARKVFPLLTPEDFPFNHWGDLKSGNFNYINLCKNKSNFVYIDRVTVSKLDEIDNAKINKKCVGALIDFEIYDVRTPRI